MINLVLMNGDVFVWNAEDWQTLREQRICGNTAGTLACLPRQDQCLGLPMLLMHEEVKLCLDQKIARLITYNSLSKMPSDDVRAKFIEFRENSYHEQVAYFEEQRRTQISDMVDIIVEGKRRKMMGLSNKKKAKHKKHQQVSTSNKVVEIDREALIKQEFSKIVPISRESCLIQTATESPWLNELGMEVAHNFPTTQDEALRCRVFADLWQRGRYVTSGHKFGGHFLVYPGDPIKFHAHYIIVCRLSHTVLPASELVTLARLGTSVRKSVVMATLGSRGEQCGNVVYHTITWVP